MEATTTLSQENEALKAEVARLTKLAYTDSLTGLNNRLAMEEAWNGAVVVLLDLNKFKAVNDTQGHEAGDNVLIDFANFLASLEGTSAYRLGGDEFVLFLEGAETNGTLAAIAAWEGLHGTTSSAGSAQEASLSESLAVADKALYANKAVVHASMDRRSNR